MKFTKVLAICLFTAASSFAGVTYDFHSEITGMQQMTMDGTVAVDGPNLRMVMARGDGRMFKDGAILLSHDGGKTISVYDAATKTYFELSMAELASSISSTMNSPAVKVTFTNPVVNAKDAGDGGTVEGYPAQKSVLDASIDLNIDAMGQAMISKMSMQTESWTTDKLGSVAANIFQQRSMLTGIEALDKLIEAQAASLKGRFPLKQVTTVHLTMNGQDITTTNTASVTNVKQKTIDAAVFVAPEGYARVDNPLEAMKKR